MAGTKAPAAPTVETEEAPKVKRYVVLADAVTVPVGQRLENGKVPHARVARGGQVTGPASSETIAKLIRLGAIQEVKNARELNEVQTDLTQGEQSQHRLTARKAAKASGAADDPVAAGLAEFAPLPADLPDVRPATVTDIDLAADTPDLPTE